MIDAFLQQDCPATARRVRRVQRRVFLVGGRISWITMLGIVGLQICARLIVKGLCGGHATFNDFGIAHHQRCNEPGPGPSRRRRAAGRTPRSTCRGQASAANLLKLIGKRSQLETQRLFERMSGPAPVIRNMGVIAARGGEEGLRLFDRSCWRRRVSRECFSR